MPELVVYVGSQSAQGIRENNEDRLVVDMENRLFLVADGMGGQESGERASGLAAEIIPRIVQDRLAADDAPRQAIERAMAEANEAIIAEGKCQPEGRRMGTTAVLALHCNGEVIIGNLGDSRAYLIRNQKVQLLTDDHSVAHALMLTGALTPEEARVSRYQNVLHKFLGCAAMTDGPDIFPLKPQAGDCLLLATDGLTNFVNDSDLCHGGQGFANVQAWAEHLVQLALKRGSKDNVTCIVLAFAEH